MTARVLIAAIILAMAAIAGGKPALAGDADVVQSQPLNGGGRVELYQDGEFACFDANDVPSVGAACRSTAGSILEVMTASAQQLYLKAGQAERSGDNQTAIKLYEAILKRFPDNELAIRANDNLLTIHRVGEIRDSNERAATQQRRALEDVAERARIQEQNNRAQANSACEQRRSVCSSSCRMTDTACYNNCYAVCSTY
jgi:hypothetical protein